MDFRARVGDDRFADLAFADLQVDPVGALAAAYERIGLEFPDRSRAGGDAVGGEPRAGSARASTPTSWRSSASMPTRCTERFARYMATYDAAA